MHAGILCVVLFNQLPVAMQAKLFLLFSLREMGNTDQKKLVPLFNSYIHEHKHTSPLV